MCGIGGCVLRPGVKPSLDRLQAMRDALAHRGPDGTGIEIVENVALVHTRLAIVDVSERAHQPMRHPGGRHLLSYNGEIFNHAELRAQMAADEFVSEGDTASLLQALAFWGPSCLSRLNGQFALALLDLDARRVLLARDRFGIKPLYVSYTTEGVWFSSEPGALQAVGIDPPPRSGGWREIADWSCYRGTATLQDGIDRVPPGSYVEISIDDLTSTSHEWDSISDHVLIPERARLQTSSRPDLVSELESVLRSAVEDSLLGDVPIGVLCSGGVDSSLITALAAEMKGGLLAFGARCKADPALDEGPAAERVADWLGIELDLLEVTEDNWRSGFVSATLRFGAPLATASSVSIAEMARRARRRGIKVLLTGEGADELFAGYNSPHEYPLSAVLSPTERFIRGIEPLLFGNPLLSLRGLRNRLDRLLPSRAVQVAESSCSVEQSPSTSAAPHPTSNDPRVEYEQSLLEAMDFTLSHLLNRMDANMMQMSVEARVPYLDPRVVEFAINLPLEARVVPWSKGILRDLAQRVLPWSIAHRRKIYGMDFDAGQWIEDAADLGFLADGLFRDVFKIPERDFEELLGSAEGSLRVRLWSAEVWCRAVFGEQSVERIEKELWARGG